MNVASRRTSTTIKFGAKCMHDYPKRFGLFASIPFPARMLHTKCRGRHCRRWFRRRSTFFGTDYSAEPIESTVNEIPNLGISRDVLEMLERKNAERLFPRFKE